MEVDELAKPRCSFLMIYWLYDLDNAQQLRVWVQSKDQQYWHICSIDHIIKRSLIFNSQCYKAEHLTWHACCLRCCTVW